MPIYIFHFFQLFLEFQGILDDAVLAPVRQFREQSSREKRKCRRKRDPAAAAAAAAPASPAAAAAAAAAGEPAALRGGGGTQLAGSGGDMRHQQKTTAITVAVSARRGAGNIESATTAIKSSNCLFCSSFFIHAPKDCHEKVVIKEPPFKYHS